MKMEISVDNVVEYHTSDPLSGLAYFNAREHGLSSDEAKQVVHYVREMIYDFLKNDNVNLTETIDYVIEEFKDFSECSYAERKSKVYRELV